MHGESASAGVGGYLREVWEFRYFWMTLVKFDLQNRYKRSVLGLGWSLLHPIAMTAILCFAFHTIFQVGLRDYAPLVLSGMAFWNFISSCTVEGASAFHAAHAYIKAERVPLAVYPLRVVLGVMFHFSVILALTLLLAAVLRGGLDPAPLLTLAPTIALMFAFGWAVAVIMAFTCVHFPDVQHLSTLGLQMLFYLTPILYPPEVVNSRGMGAILRYNPLGYFVELLRAPIVQGMMPSPQAYAIAGGVTLCLVAGAVLILHRCEKRLIFALL